MNIILSFKTTLIAILQIFLIGFLGYYLARKKKVSEEGFRFLSFFVINIALPFFIFTHLVDNFQFSQYAFWWIFPFVSLIVIAFGSLIGWLFIVMNKEIRYKREFLSLVSFHNCGYLPLMLANLILQGQDKETMFIYIVLFISGINLIMWSFGVSILTSKKNSFEFSKLFSSPVIATLSAFIFILLGLNRFVPSFVLEPVRSLGDCTLALATLLVGANLAKDSIKNILDRDIFDVILIKLFLMPTVALLILKALNLFNLIGLLIILQVAMPSATSLSIIAGHYRLNDRLLSRAVFWTHIFCIISVPIFLGLFSWLGMVR